MVDNLGLVTNNEEFCYYKNNFRNTKCTK